MSDPVVVAVASGKGGVGKSTVSLNLALALTAQGQPTGLLDADIYGPDIPLMVGITRRAPTKGVTVWRNPAHGRKIEPLERFGIKVMSTQFLVAKDQALSWSAPLVELLVQRFTSDIAWGEIDFLVIDLPPGTADIQQQLARRLELSRMPLIPMPHERAAVSVLRGLPRGVPAGSAGAVNLGCGRRPVGRDPYSCRSRRWRRQAAPGRASRECGGRGLLHACSPPQVLG